MSSLFSSQFLSEPILYKLKRVKINNNKNVCFPDSNNKIHAISLKHWHIIKQKFESPLKIHPKIPLLKKVCFPHHLKTISSFIEQTSKSVQCNNWIRWNAQFANRQLTTSYRNQMTNQQWHYFEVTNLQRYLYTSRVLEG